MHNNDNTFLAGKTRIHVEKDAATMGVRSAELVADAMKTAYSHGRKPVLWLMAAPSGFAFYNAFVTLCGLDSELAGLCAKTEFFQFDDYPVPRGDPRFPITFRYLLETRFFGPLASACGSLGPIHTLEIGGANDARVCSEYAGLLLRAAEDPSNFLIQLKGIGMDGHWGFHGAETPLDAPPAVVRVEMNSANIHQQKLDWPQYFRDDSDVPPYACTCNVALFRKAHLIVDNVPQASKAYSVLATYGSEAIIGDVPSSALKAHPDSYAFLTSDSAWALLEIKKARAANAKARLSEKSLARLETLWDAGDGVSRRENIAKMRAVLERLEFI